MKKICKILQKFEKQHINIWYKKKNTTFLHFDLMMKKAFYNINTIDQATAEILIYGYIGTDEVSSGAFVADLKGLEKTHININVRINSGGGSVFEGIAIFNAIKNSKANITVYIDGLAASMGSIIAMAGKTIKMSRFARLMFHKPGGIASGSAGELRQTAEQLESLERTLIEMCEKRTGLSKDQVKAKYFIDGVDVYLTAEQALIDGLIDEIYDGEKVDIPATAKINSKQLWEYYNSINYNTNNMKKVALLCKLNEAATEDQIIQFLTDMMAKEKAAIDKAAELTNKLKTADDKIAEFEAKEKEAAKQKVKDLVDGAVASKKITEDMRSHYTQLAEANYEATSAIIAKMQGYNSITAQLGQNAGTDDETAKWSFTDWQKKNPKGLAEMKEKNITAFKALYVKEFNKEPKI